MKLWSTLLCLCLAVPQTAAAAIGLLDEVPAATVLVPYFEVDLASATGRNTLVTVQAATFQSVLGHVTLWSDVGVPVLNFDVYLTGYDAVTLDLGAILAGTLPATASLGQDPSDAISKHGARSQDVNFASCTGKLPPAKLAASKVSGLKLALTGKASPLFSNKCVGASHGDEVARGYLTVDTVSSCTALNPGQAGYFVDGGGGIATNQNLLLGHVSYADPSAKKARGLSAVHLEAANTGIYTTGAGANTFYRSLVGATGADNREGLATVWNADYVTDRSSLVVWRDSGAPQVAFTCGALPSPFPLPQQLLFAFDTQEQVVDLSAEKPFSLAAGLVPVGVNGVPTVARAGMLHFASSFNGEVRPSYVAVLPHPEDAAYATSYRATQFDNAGIPNPGGPATNNFRSEQPERFGNLDSRPAATLLLPYFEVSFGDPNKVQTRLTVNNNSAEATLARVTLWTDLGVPTYGFIVYLTGYDVETIDLRMLFGQGLVAPTATNGQDPTDQISPHGPFSQDINFASASGSLPYRRLKAADLEGLRKAHVGEASSLLGGKCGGAKIGDGIARGYVTIDTVNQYSTAPPSTALGQSVMTLQNILSGSYTFLDRQQHIAFSDSLVGLQASFIHPSVLAGRYTFYGRYNGWNGADHREPLPSSWQVPFESSAEGKSSLFVWRDSGTPTVAFTCGGAAAGQPGTPVELLAFDEQEGVTALSGNPFNRTSMRVAVGSALGVTAPVGALHLDLNSAAAGGPPANPKARQSYVAAVHTNAVEAHGWARSGRPLAHASRHALYDISTPTSPTTETGRSSSFTVVLRVAPTQTVTLDVSVGARATVSPTSLVFTTGDWNVPRTVTVTGLDNLSFDTDQTYGVGLTTTTTDPVYGAADAPDLLFQNVDNE